MPLTREQILSMKRPAPLLVSVPEWGGEVYVLAMPAKLRDEYEASLREKKGGVYEMNVRGARAKLVAMTLCDETGGRLMTEEDVQALGEQWAAPIDRIFEAASKYNRMTAEDVASLVEKNGTPTPALTSG